MILFLQGFDNITKDQEEKFYQLYNKYYRYAYKISFNVVKSNLGIEEIIQEVFMSVWRTLDVITDETSAKAWISTIARNTAINALKGKISSDKNILDVDDDIMYSAAPDSACDPADLLINQDSVEGIYNEMKNLGKNYADVLLLHYKFNLSPDEIATFLKRNPKTVYTQLVRGKELLKERLILVERGIRK